MGYGDLHAYGPIEAAFILCYMLFGIILNAYILGKQMSMHQGGETLLTVSCIYLRVFAWYMRLGY